MWNFHLWKDFHRTVLVLVGGSGSFLILMTFRKFLNFTKTSTFNMSLQWNLCDPTPGFSDILWLPTRISGPKIFLLHSLLKNLEYSATCHFRHPTQPLSDILWNCSRLVYTNELWFEFIDWQVIKDSLIRVKVTLTRI